MNLPPRGAGGAEEPSAQHVSHLNPSFRHRCFYSSPNAIIGLGRVATVAWGRPAVGAAKQRWSMRKTSTLQRSASPPAGPEPPPPGVYPRQADLLGLIKPERSTPLLSCIITSSHTCTRVVKLLQDGKLDTKSQEYFGFPFKARLSLGGGGDCTCRSKSRWIPVRIVGWNSLNSADLPGPGRS